MALRITRENAKALGPAVEALVADQKARKPSKYKNVHTEYGGCVYASKREAAYAAQLDLAVKAGAVKWWVRQVAFRLGPDHRYVVDFVIVPARGDTYALDVKGAWTMTFKRHARLWKKYGVCELHVVMKNETKVIIREGGGRG